MSSWSVRHQSRSDKECQLKDQYITVRLFILNAGAVDADHTTSGRKDVQHAATGIQPGSEIRAITGSHFREAGV